MTWHRLMVNGTGRHMVGLVYEVEASDGELIPYWSVASASGPMRNFATDMGELEPGDALNLSYDYETEEYRLFRCTVVRVNRKSITVHSHRTNATVRITL